jgi:DNA-binding ferritin-like protein (Dps family)
LNNNNKPKPTNLIESPESQHFKNLIDKLQEGIRNAQENIKQNLWSISALKEARKKALKEANKK